VLKLNLDVTRVICGRHGEVFRPRWRAGYPMFVSIGLECLMSQPDIVERVEGAVRALKIGNGTPRVENEIQAVEHMLGVRPLCCQLPPRDLYDVLLEVNQKANVWEVGRCSLCGGKRPGALYRKAPPTVKAVNPAGSYPHVCLACVCGLQKGV